VAHSWAGGVGILAAAGNPLVAGLVLLASIGPSCLLPIDPILAAPGLGEIISFATLALGRAPLRAKAGRLLGAHLDAEDTPYARASGYATLHRPLWRSFLTEQRALTRQLDLVSAALPLITVPTVVLSGTDDRVIPRQTVRALVNEIPGARAIDIDGGHDLQLRQPGRVADEIAALVREVLPSPVGP
jgi:pimeloyl-ACP methyl ester carboxylesterase